MKNSLRCVLWFFQSVIKFIVSGIHLIWRSMIWLLRNLFGIQLTPPAWLPCLAKSTQRTTIWIKANPRQAYGAAATFLLIIGGAYGGWRWYQNLPKPVEVHYAIKAPGRTKIEEKDAKPDPL